MSDTPSTPPVPSTSAVPAPAPASASAKPASPRAPTAQPDDPSATPNAQSPFTESGQRSAGGLSSGDQATDTRDESTIARNPKKRNLGRSEWGYEFHF